MINRNQHPLGWALFMYELEDAQEHLSDLIASLSTRSDVCEVDLRIALGHVYAHLNRAWFRRNVAEDFADADRDTATQFPEDIDPVG